MDSASAFGTSKDAYHLVHRHDDDAPIDKVARAIRVALQRGDAVVWIGTDTGLRWLTARLTELGVDVIDARLSRSMLCLDASHTLAGITVGGLIDIVRFAELVGAQIDKSANGCARLAIFCEAATSSVSSTASAFEALLKSFAQSRAVFKYRAYRTPACRREPTAKPGHNRWSVGGERHNLAIQIPLDHKPEECT